MNFTFRQHGSLLPARRIVLAGLLAFGTLLPFAAHPGIPLDDWRGKIAEARRLADNDAPQAYLDAQRLQRDTPSGATYADRARVLNLLSRIELHLALMPQSVRHSAEARTLARQANDADGQVEAILNFSLGAINQARFDDMIDATQDGMALLGKVGREELRAEMMFQAAMMYLRFGQVEELVTLAMQGLDVAKGSRDPRVHLYAEQSMATAFMQSKRHEEAREHYRNMLEAARQSHSSLMEAAALLGLASVIDGIGDHKEAVRLTEQATGLFRRVGAPFYVGHARHQLADMYRVNRQPEKALPLVDANIKLYEEHDNPIGLWWTLQLRSHILQALGRLDAARRDAGRAYVLAQKSGFNVYLGGSAQRLSEVAAAQGDHTTAYRWAAEAMAHKEKTDREKTGERIAQLAKRFSEESKQREIDELNRENERHEAQQRQLLIVLVASIALLAVTAFFLLRLRKSRAEIRALNVGLEQRVMERTVELLESRQSLAEAQRIAHVGSWELEHASNKLAWSDESHRIFEIEPQQFGGSYEAFLDTVHPEDRDRVHRTFLSSLENRKPYEIEHRLSFPDGRIKYVHEHCETSYDADGRPLRSIGTVQDITERKEIENALHESRQLLTEAQRIAHVGSWDLDHVSNKLTWSDESQRIFEIDPQQVSVTYEVFLDTVHPEDRDTVNRVYLASLENRTPYEIVHRLLFPDGRIKYVHEHCETFYSADGRPLRSIGTTQDITERKEIENALRESRQLLTEAQRIAQVGSWEYDIASDTHTWSEELFRIYEIDPLKEGASYEGCFNATHPDDRDAITRAYLESVETGQPYESEHRLLMADGRIKYVHERCETIRGPDGTLLRAVGMMQDITERKQAEQKLKEALEFSEGIINAIPDILFEIDRDGRYLNVWTQNPELLAAQREVLLGRTFHEVLSPENAEASMEAIREADEKGLVQGRDICIDLPQGKRWFSHTLSKKISGVSGKVTFLALSRDITERKQLEAELRASRNFLDSVIDAVPDPIFVKDRQHNWILLNEAFCRFTALPHEALIGKSDYEIFPKEEADVYWEKDELVFGSGEVNLNEEIFTSANGEKHFIQTKKTPFMSSDGSQMLVGVIRDITDRKQYEAAREAALAEAQRLAKMRSEFIAHMSHELRTPLNGILGYAQMLGRDDKLDEKQHASMDVIRQSGEHLLALIDDILDLARIESGKLELDMSDIPLARFLNVVAGIVGVKAKQKQLEFVCKFAPDLPEGICGDEKRLRQVLLNLLSNAVKFTDSGKIALSVSRVTPSRLAFAVTDTGIGIAPADREAIFQSFEQVSDTQHRLDGTGLGLSISRQLVRLMGGDIAVESRPGEGSTFRFELELPEVSIEPDVLRIPVADTQQVEPEGENEPAGPLIAPPQEELQALHKLALLGNMRDIAEYAKRIGGIDPRYRPFAERLRRMANNFQSKAILAFVEGHLI